MVAAPSKGGTESRETGGDQDPSSFPESQEYGSEPNDDQRSLIVEVSDIQSSPLSGGEAQASQDPSSSSQQMPSGLQLAPPLNIRNDPICCSICQMYLNGTRHYEYHSVLKKHKKHPENSVCF